METTVTENSIPTGEGLTFEKVWAMFQESDRRMEESRREREEANREWDRKWAESQKKWDKEFGHLHNRFGELAEHLVAPGINKRFNELGYHFDAQATGGFKIWGEDGKVKAEIDLMLLNDDTIMAVEVKSKPDEYDLRDYIKRLETLRGYWRSKNDMRQVIGAMAGAVFGEAIKRSVIKAGLYVIEQTGDTMKINVPEGFVPRKW